MIGIALSPEQIEPALPEVRCWIEKELASSLGLLALIDRQSHTARSELAACSREESLGIFELIKDDYLASQVAQGDNAALPRGLARFCCDT